MSTSGVYAGPQISFAVVSASGLRALSPTLRSLFLHPFVASYQVGFGPPLVRSSPKLIERVKATKSALEKLDVYIDCCLLDEEVRRRLHGLFKKQMVQRRGPLEAEELDEASSEAIDFLVRLHHPAAAPPEVIDRYRHYAIAPGEVSLRAAPETM